MTTAASSGIYFFLGNISSHVLHALPLWHEIGGTFVVTSRQTENELLKYNIPVVRVDDVPYRWAWPGLRPKRIHEYTSLGAPLKKTYDFLNTHARIVIFYELFEFEHPEWIDAPKKLFLTHGNMLKSYMTMHPRRLEIVKHYDYMAALSPYMKAKFIADGVPAQKLIDVGIARTDELLDAVRYRENIRQAVSSQLAVDSQKPIILYAPTFWGESSVYTTGLEIAQSIDSDYTLLLRLHPQTPKKIIKQYQIVAANRPTIHLVDDISPTELLAICDAAIVDRSSIVLELLLLDTPLLFAYDSDSTEKTPDYESIQAVVDYSPSIVRGDKALVNQKIAQGLQNGIDSQLWNRTRKAVWFYPSGGSTKAIAEFVTSQLKND